MNEVAGANGHLLAPPHATLLMLRSHDWDAASMGRACTLPCRTYSPIGLVSVGLFLPHAFIAEGSTRPEGTDGDNAAESLLYLQEHPLAYRLSGLFLLLAALGLIRSATAVPWRTPFLTAIGSVAGGLWAFTGALRISSPGPIDHIRGYDEDWGEAAYLSVQMTGTQGGLLSGVVLTAAWIVTGCVIAWRSRTLPRALCAIGQIGLVYPLGSALGIAGVGGGSGLWFLSVASLIVGLPVWFIATGIWAVTTGSRSTQPDGQVSTA